jgi:hypothetical protein
MNALFKVHLCAGTVVAIAVGLAAPTIAQVPPSYGMDFMTVGAAGNRATRPDEVPWQPGLQVGSVPYQYRMTHTEVTASQYIGFVRAYAPYWAGAPGDPALTGTWIFWQPDRGYYIPPGYENYAADAMWATAARFCNWLHNGESNDRSAFETGVYDMASGARERLPGATFWLPTENEWIKSAYYDVNRYGPGEDGYWLYPDRDNDPLIRALPADGGETNAGLGVLMPVGQYPNAASPWGLLDLSGGDAEWLETHVNVQGGEFRAFRGSMDGGNPGDASDRLDYISEYSFASAPFGIRLCSVIPAPGAVVIGIVWSFMFIQRKKR